MRADSEDSPFVTPILIQADAETAAAAKAIENGIRNESILADGSMNTCVCVSLLRVIYEIPKSWHPAPTVEIEFQGSQDL